MKRQFHDGVAEVSTPNLPQVGNKESHCVVSFQRRKIFSKLQRQSLLEIRLSNLNIQHLLFEAVRKTVRFCSESDLPFNSELRIKMQLSGAVCYHSLAYNFLSREHFPRNYSQ